MFSPRKLTLAGIEPLEQRIAPAVTILHPLPDLVVGPAMVGTNVDLGRLTDELASDSAHTIITLHTNFDADLTLPGIQESAPIVIEMLDDEAPLTVQNFLSYLTNPSTQADYVGTFFHRAVRNFVLQGGGFEASTPDTHIPTPFTVHNEFDASRSNVLGTLAMAKTGRSPNSATSEWFINLGDNAANLDNQNGGFTVFARVVSGLDVAQAISQLPYADAGGGGTITPVQNFNADPDANPNTPAPEPKPQNLVQITSFQITPPPAGQATGISYSLVSIKDATTGLASDLVTGTLNGAALHLDYKAHAAGVVNVTVRASDGQGSTADDTFAVDLQANLVASFPDDPFAGVIVGGDTQLSKIEIGNNGGGWATGNVDVKVSLVQTNNGGVIATPRHDFVLATIVNQAIDLAPGGKLTLNKALTIPQQLVDATGGLYRVIVELSPVNAQVSDRFSDDNVSFDGNVHRWENRFGTFTVPGFDERHDVELTYAEADGDLVRLAISKGGNGQLTKDGDLVNFAVLQAKPGSVLTTDLLATPASGGGDLDFHNVELGSFMERVNLGKATVSGAVSAGAGVGTLRLSDISGGGLFSLGKAPAAATAKTKLIFQRVADFSIESLAPIRSLTAVDWLETAGPQNSIAAPSIGKLTITGRASTEAATAVRGNLEVDVSLTRDQSLGTLKVAGYLRNATVQTLGDVGRVRVGGLDHAELFVGVAARPDERSDFGLHRTLSSFRITGVENGDAFIDSDVAAARIGSVFVQQIAGTSSTEPFGIVADAVAHYNRDQVFTVQPGGKPRTLDGQGNYVLQIV